MINWLKQTSLDPKPNNNKEIWTRQENNKNESFEVNTYLGKKTNLLSLKKNIIDDLKQQVSEYQSSRKEIYKSENLENVTSCPVCNTKSENTKSELMVYGAEYVSCNYCTHVYVIKRPTKTALEGFYFNNITYAATYTDKKSAEFRMNAIAVPWKNWMLDVFQKRFGRKPEGILDIGCGAGHFVKACREDGLKADGIELSETSRKFAKDIWDVELDSRDFTEVADEYKGYEVVTFWGLLEHTPNPKSILDTATRVIKQNKNGGMIISSVPRWNCLGSAIQKLANDTIIRHLDPMGHIMCFTDTSIAELYYRCGLKPCDAWYYGMDVYEMLMQIGHKVGSYEHFLNTPELQMELQQSIDNVVFSDQLTLVGVL